MADILQWIDFMRIIYPISKYLGVVCTCSCIHMQGGLIGLLELFTKWCLQVSGSVCTRFLHCVEVQCVLHN